MDAGAVFVTGGAQGLGRAIVEAFSDQGRVVFLADRHGADATAQALRDEGADVRAIDLDVADPAAVVEAVETADRAAPLEVLVNNAGIAFDTPLVDVTPEAFDRLVGVNVRGVFFALQAAARCMGPRGRGVVVNLASTSGFTASHSPMAAYDLSKAAVRMLTASAARELAASGIRVNAVAPGTIDTSLTRGLAGDPDALQAMVDARIPLGRIGRPADIAHAVTWLASDAAGYVTGHTLVVDGGWLT